MGAQPLNGIVPLAEQRENVVPQPKAVTSRLGRRTTEEVNDGQRGVARLTVELVQLVFGWVSRVRSQAVMDGVGRNMDERGLLSSRAQTHDHAPQIHHALSREQTLVSRSAQTGSPAGHRSNLHLPVAGSARIVNQHCKAMGSTLGSRDPLPNEEMELTSLQRKSTKRARQAAARRTTTAVRLEVGQPVAHTMKV